MRYEDIPIPTGPSQPAPGWPQGAASSFLPLQLQQPAKEEQGPLNDFNEMMSTLTGYPYQPYPLVDPNERYQRYGEVFFLLLYNFLVISCFSILFLVSFIHFIVVCILFAN
ncbi:hypothetical protein Hanom_Chr05g00397591 [Helianthus anomalus]